ncbi:malate:quinone oxidoreductase, partial [Proteus mirabilis]
GTDVDYGALTHLLVKQLSQQDNFELHYKHDVIDIKRNETGGWNIEVKDLTTHDKYLITAKYVFVGAGGRAIDLLQKSGIPEG